MRDDSIPGFTEPSQSEAILTENLVERVTSLEKQQLEVAPVLSSVETMVTSISENLMEMKQTIRSVALDVKDLTKSHNEIKTQYDSRIKVLEDIEISRKERKKFIIKTIGTGVGSLIVALIIYFLKLK